MIVTNVTEHAVFNIGAWSKVLSPGQSAEIPLWGYLADLAARSCVNDQLAEGWVSVTGADVPAYFPLAIPLGRVRRQHTGANRWTERYWDGSHLDFDLTDPENPTGSFVSSAPVYLGGAQSRVGPFDPAHVVVGDTVGLWFDGSWTGDAPITFSHSWQSSPDGPFTTIDELMNTGSWTDVTDPAIDLNGYVFQASDVGRWWRMLVHATNDAGSATAVAAGIVNGDGSGWANGPVFAS